MNRPIAVLTLVALLGGCAAARESRFNPMNWFGKSEQVERVELPQKPADDRDLVRNVLSMAVEPVPSGAIIRATGLPPSQGWWKADLVAQPVTEDGTLVFDFRILPPPSPTAVNTPQSREVVAATHLSHAKLANVRRIVVQGLEDARSAGR